MTTLIMAADLFCGAGGTSTGLLNAARALGYQVELLAVNHSEMAIATHSKNHPGVKHFNSDLKDIDPLTVIPGGKLNLLVASPECTHFSRARGGKPVSKQSRASVKYVLRWIGTLDIENVLIENVAEFKDWGPLHRIGPNAGKPIKKRKGEYFNRFISKLKAHGYSVAHRVLNAADYGDATTRKRLFVMARKGKAVIWPEPTHSQHGTDMFGTRPLWRPARAIIDWFLQGESIFERKKPLSINTLKRIQAGLKKYGGQALPTVDTSNRFGLVQPFIIQMDQGGYVHSIDEPMKTITSADAWGLVEPFIVMFNGTDEGKLESSSKSIDEPLPTIVSVNHAGLVQPFLVEYHGTSGARSVDEPLGTQTSRDRFALVQPQIFERDGKRYLMDIRFRMLQPQELANAMSFPAGYKFQGNREQIVKQIGNAVPVCLAMELCKSILSS